LRLAEDGQTFFGFRGVGENVNLGGIKDWQRFAIAFRVYHLEAFKF
jgi:hypothetical protein